MNTRILHQDRVWIDATGRARKLRKMDVHYRANLIPFLRGNCRTLYSFEHLIDFASVNPAVAEEWLEQTKLMRRLVELEHGRTIDERRSTHQRNVAHEQATGYQKVRNG